MHTPQPHIVITGNPLEGFTYHGPFESRAEAAQYGNSDGNIENGDWWIAPLTLDYVIHNAITPIDETKTALTFALATVIVADLAASLRTLRSEMGISPSDPGKLFEAEEVLAHLDALEWNIANLCAEHNPRFDRAKFLAACKPE